MKKFNLLILSSLVLIGVLTQSHASAQKVKKDSLLNKIGANSKHFTHVYIGFGYIIPISVAPGGEVINNKSDNFTLGIKYKRKFSNFESIGCYLAYDQDLFRLNQNNKLNLDTVGKINNKTLKIHSKEDLIYYAFTFGIFNRFNFFPKRGNRLGTYLDLGAYGSWNFSINHYTEDEVNDNTLKDYTSGLDYPQRFTYGIYAQLGFNKFSIYFKKRLSNLFKDKYYEDPYDFPELPRYECGIQLAIF